MLPIAPASLTLAGIVQPVCAPASSTETCWASTGIFTAQLTAVMSHVCTATAIGAFFFRAACSQIFASFTARSPLAAGYALKLIIDIKVVLALCAL